MLHKLSFMTGQGAARVCQGLSLPASERSRNVSINCWRSIPRRCATRSTSSPLKVGFTSRQQLPQGVQSIPWSQRRAGRFAPAPDCTGSLRIGETLRSHPLLSRRARVFEQDRVPYSSPTKDISFGVLYAVPERAFWSPSARLGWDRSSSPPRTFSAVGPLFVSDSASSLARQLKCFWQLPSRLAQRNKGPREHRTIPLIADPRRSVEC
jgi:hypothetical protein